MKKQMNICCHMLYNIIIYRYFITSHHESHFQHYNIRGCYGVLRRAYIYSLSCDRLFLTWENIRGGRTRFYRWKYCVDCSLEVLWIWVG